MRLNPALRILLGLLTVLPIAYLVLFLTYIFPKLTSFIEPPNAQPEQYFAFFHSVTRLHLAAVFFTFALIVFYVVYLFKTDLVPAEKKALWASVLILGNMAAMPVFWYLYVWRDSRGEGAA